MRPRVLSCFQGADPLRAATREATVATLLLLTNALQPSAEVLPALGLLAPPGPGAPAEAAALVDAPPADVVLVDGRRDLPARPQPRAGCCARPGVDVPAARSSSPRAASPPSPPTGASTTSCSTRPARPRSRPGCGSRSAGSTPARRRRAPPDEIRSGDLTHRRGDLHRAGPRPRARPDLQGVRAAQVPRAAPRPGLHPRPAAAGGLGLRLLRRHPHRRRPRPAAARQARPRARGADRHRAQRRLPVRRCQPRVDDRSPSATPRHVR